MKAMKKTGDHRSYHEDSLSIEDDNGQYDINISVERPLTVMMGMR